MSTACFEPSQVRNCTCGVTMSELVEEVDIGVGVQRHVRGYECPGCGVQVALRDCCGSDVGEAHRAWCEEAGPPP